MNDLGELKDSATDWQRRREIYDKLLADNFPRKLRSFETLVSKLRQVKLGDS